MAENLKEKLDDYDVSFMNGDIAEVIDAVKMYSAVFGIEIDFHELITNKECLYHISKPMINEIELGFDIDGDGVLEESVKNPFYIKEGNWDQSQLNGIKEYQIHHQTAQEI